MSGMPGRSGRPKLRPNRANALRRMSALIPVSVAVIQETIEGVNRDRLKYEAAIYNYEQCFGKPKQSTELDISGGQDIGANLIVQLLKAASQRQLAVEEPKLLKEYEVTDAPE